MRRSGLMLCAALLAGCAGPGAGVAPTPCPEHFRGQQMCTQEYFPVCGWDAQGVARTYGNVCNACVRPEVVTYTSGACAAPVDH
ncbi:MAG: hypothetical protein RBS22_09960 [Spongiibacteraceae bacterium]|nr:hypothetical protein [Spongiibacteraceae bacterium]